MFAKPMAFLVEDDLDVRQALSLLLEAVGIDCLAFDSAEEFLATIEKVPHQGPRCLILDVRLPGMNGLQLLQVLRARGVQLPVIILTGHADIPMAVTAMKGGAFDFLEKPLHRGLILDRVRVAIDQDALLLSANSHRQDLTQRLQALTPREHGVMELMVTGKNNKRIAQELDISVQTAAKHTHRVLEKMNVQNAVELARLLESAGPGQAGFAAAEPTPRLLDEQ